MRVTILAMTGKAVRLTRLGMELRNARKISGYTLNEVAQALGVQPSTVSRWEKSERTPNAKYLIRYLSLVEAPKDLIAELIKTVEASEVSPWLSVGESAQSEQRSTMLELERQATELTIVSPMLVPGLLQTDEYVRAMLTESEAPENEIDTLVVIRLGRKNILTKKNPVRLLAVTTEMALRQDIGGKGVMAEQLRSLLETVEMSNVTLRIVPFESGWNPSLEGPFALLGFSDRAPVVQTESHRSSLFFDSDADVEFFQQAVRKVLRVALSPDSSRDLIKARIKQLE